LLRPEEGTTEAIEGDVEEIAKAMVDEDGLLSITAEVCIATVTSAGVVFGHRRSNVATNSGSTADAVVWLK
jgi:hypothetical protein